MNKAFVILGLILTIDCANAGVLKSLTNKATKLFSPAAKAADSTEVSARASSLLKKYVRGGDIKTSHLDKVKVYALSSGGNESRLTDIEDKFVELEMRAWDIVENIDDAVNRGGAFKKLLVSQIESYNLLLAHLHVTTRKEGLTSYEQNFFNVLTLLNDHLKNVEVSGRGFALRPMLDYQKINQRIVKDLDASYIKID